MTADPYMTCPCGSGKKLKFCCGDILPDMLKVSRLRENQPDAAEKILVELLRKHPNREVLVEELTSLYVQFGKHSEARELLVNFLKRYPDHPRGLIWSARLSLAEDGFEASRRIVHRAFQLSSRQYSGDVAEIAGSIAVYLTSRRQTIGAYEHFALASRLATNSERVRHFMTSLAILESDSELAAPLRTRYEMMPVNGSVEAMQQDQRARKLSAIGCWEPAAIIYSRLSETNPTNGEIVYNCALCRLWDGRSQDAITLLHRASELIEDQEKAAEIEALAQLLELDLPENQYQVVRVNLPVRSLSELMTRFENSDQFHRYPDPESESDDNNQEALPGTRRAALFDLLCDSKLRSAGSLKEAVAEIDVYDLVDSAEAAVGGIQSPYLSVMVCEDQEESAVAKIRTVLGDLLNSSLPSDAIENRRSPAIRNPKDYREFDCRIFRPDELCRSEFRVLNQAISAEMVQSWLSRPLSALGGKSPREAAKDPAQKRVLAAAVHVLESVAPLFERQVDGVAVRRELGIPEPTELILGTDRHCSALSVFELRRIDPRKLDDQRLAEYSNRTSMIGLLTGVRAALDELIARPEGLRKFGSVRACLMRAMLARSENDLTRMTECLAKARELAAESKQSFREILEVEIRELSLRLDDPKDPELINVLHRIRDRYISKLPDIAEIIGDQLKESGCEHLLAELELPVGVGADATSSVWTPGSSAEPSGGGNLWLPGQE